MRKQIPRSVSRKALRGRLLSVCMQAKAKDTAHRAKHSRTHKGLNSLSFDACCELQQSTSAEHRELYTAAQTAHAVAATWHEGTAPPLFIAATRQHVGKTTVSLAVLSGLRKRFGDRVGFVKPVGQQHVPVGAKGRVDKDVQLMKEYFGLTTWYEDAPLLMPRDYTSVSSMAKCSDDQTSIQDAVKRVQETSDVLI